jgi:hypothetical protein
MTPSFQNICDDQERKDAGSLANLPTGVGVSPICQLVRVFNAGLNAQKKSNSRHPALPRLFYHYLNPQNSFPSSFAE